MSLYLWALVGPGKCRSTFGHFGLWAGTHGCVCSDGRGRGCGYNKNLYWPPFTFLVKSVRAFLYILVGAIKIITGHVYMCDILLYNIYVNQIRRER